MTWEQELKIQSKEIAAKIAPIMAKNMAEGMAQKKNVETARNLLGMNLTAEQIAQATSLPLERVLALQKELSAPATD